MTILPQFQACSQCGHDICARKVTLINSLSMEELKDVLDLFLRNFVRKGEHVANEGDLSDSLIIVNRGSLKNRDPDNKTPEITLPLSREEIASAIGLTRETISRKLSQLSTEGIIDILENRKIRISDMKALKIRGELR